jgi:hypothetical protein
MAQSLRRLVADYDHIKQILDHAEETREGERLDADERSLALPPAKPRPRA